MDNVQDPIEQPLNGQAQPIGEQMPDVQSSESTQQPQAPSMGDSANEPSQETSFEALAAKKGFKSPDDLAKAYASLESRNTQVSQKKADLEKLFFENQQSAPKQEPQYVQPQYQYQPQPNESDKAIQELKQFVHKEAVEPLTQAFERKLAVEMAKLELNQVVKDNPDFHNYANQVKELKGKYPNMTFGEALTFAKAMKGDLVQEARSQGLKEGTYLAQKQIGAQVAAQKPAVEDKIEANDLLQGAGKRWTVKQSTSPEIKARIKAEQSLLEKQLFGQILGQ